MLGLPVSDSSLVIFAYIPIAGNIFVFRVSRLRVILIMRNTVLYRINRLTVRQELFYISDPS